MPLGTEIINTKTKQQVTYKKIATNQFGIPRHSNNV